MEGLDMLFDDGEGQLQDFYYNPADFEDSVPGRKAKKRCIADDLAHPPIPRDAGIFAGLTNQGATCYLNSLFQSFFFSPETCHSKHFKKL